MDQLPIKALEVFLAIAEQGSLRAAADALGVGSPAVSYQLKSLEDRLGTALFIRTTRSIQMTDAGRALLARARPAVSELGEALEEARTAGGARKGSVRLTLPYVAYRLAIAKKLAAFQERFPDIEVELSLSEAFVDIAADGIHAGVRLGDHIAEDMIAVRLGPPMRQVFFAAPSYLERNGRPKRPDCLLRHNCIRYRYIASGRLADWQVQGPQGIATIDVKGNLIVDSTQALIGAACDGLGIGWLFRPAVAEELRSRRLKSVLDSYAIESPGYFLYYPRANARIEVLRVFIDFMKEPGGGKG